MLLRCFMEMRNLKTLVVTVAMAGCFMLPHGTAHAVYPVHDATNYAKIVSQLQEVINQYNMLKSQYDWFKQTYDQLRNPDLLKRFASNLLMEQINNIKSTIKKDDVFPELPVSEMFEVVQSIQLGNNNGDIIMNVAKAADKIEEQRKKSNDAIDQSRKDLMDQAAEIEKDITELTKQSQEEKSVLALQQINNMIAAKRSQLQYILSGVNVLNGQQRIINRQADEQRARNEAQAAIARGEVEAKAAQERAKGAGETEKPKGLLDYGTKKKQNAWSGLFN